MPAPLIPAKAGTQAFFFSDPRDAGKAWVPASARMSGGFGTTGADPG